MFGSEILDVILGLFFLLLLVSLVCLSVCEALEGLLNNRARDLHRGIKEMLGGEGPLVAKMYEHPLIEGLYKGKYHAAQLGNLPSYIPSRTFALVLMDVLHLREAEFRLTGAFPETYPNPSVFRALRALVEAAAGDAQRIRHNIEDWYDGGMDQVSSWYKRRTQIIIAAVAFSIAAIMNLDTLAIAEYLNTVPSTRSVVIGAANASTAAQAGGLNDVLAFLGRLGNIPIGWHFSSSLLTRDQPWLAMPATAAEWLQKIVGILITGFAASIGAPLCFDVLNRFMVLRSAIKPREFAEKEWSKE